MSAPEFFIFLAAILSVTAISIVSLALSHQRKMIDLRRGQDADNVRSGELERLKQEISELKGIVYQQALDADSMRQLLREKELSRNDARSNDLIVGRD